MTQKLYILIMIIINMKRVSFIIITVFCVLWAGEWHCRAEYSC